MAKTWVFDKPYKGETVLLVGDSTWDMFERTWEVWKDDRWQDFKMWSWWLYRIRQKIKLRKLLQAVPPELIILGYFVGNDLAEIILSKYINYGWI